jgi:large subunit ribosomal protein L24
MNRSSRQPRRQRKAIFAADAFHRGKRMALPLSRELRARYRRRNLPVRKGDTVRVLTGSYVGREERVARIDRRSYSITLDNVTVKKADAKLKPLPIRLSHLLLTKLNLADPWRRRVLRVTEAEPEAEESAPAMPAAESVPPAPAPPETKAAPAADAPKPAARRKKTAKATAEAST